MKKRTISKNKSPFSLAAPGLYRAGYSVIPLIPHTKKPVENNWSIYCEERADSNQMKQWNKLPDVNIGLCLGEASQVIALDFDEDMDGLHEQILSLLPSDSPNFQYDKKGARGFTRFFRYNGEKNRSWKKNGITIIELLSDGRHTVMPPSIHPNGGKYEATFGLLDEVTAEELDYLPEGFVEKLDLLIKNKKEDVEKKENNFEVADLKAALKCINSDPYDVWIQVGMAIKDSLDDEEGFEIWDKWSQKSDKYDPDEMASRWKSFKSKGVSVSTIFYLAMENGFEFDRNKISLEGIVTPYSLMDELEDWRTKGLYAGVKPGLGKLGDFIHFRKGEFSVWTGYPGEGKSELIDSINLDLMEQGLKSLYCSLEKGPKSHTQSLIHKYTGKPIKKRTKQEQMDAIEYISRHCAMIGMSNFDTNIDNLFKIAKMYKIVEGLDIFFIDPYNYLESKKGDGVEHTKYILKKCSRMAKELGIHVALVAHPKAPDSRFGNKLPKLNKYSISGGSDFPNIADFLIAVGKDIDGNTSIDILKVRDQDIDKEGTTYLKFNKETKRHEDYDLLEF